jgi:hypothetical protein
MIFCIASTQSYEERKGKKVISTKPCRITIHSQSREEENTETNQMMRQKCNYKFTTAEISRTRRPKSMN